MKGRISHEMAARSLRGNRGVWAGVIDLRVGCLGEVSWPFCMDTAEYQAFFFNTIWQQAHPLLHSFPF